MEKLLEVNNLEVQFKSQKNIIYAVTDFLLMFIKMNIRIIGESGCGKTVTSRSMLKLNNSYFEKGSIRFKGREISDLNQKELNRIRGNKISMIFQNPSSALIP